MKVALRLAIVVLSAAVLQRGMVSQLHVGDAVLELLLLVTIATGLAAGEQAGAITGFCSGLVLDLLTSGGPLGLWALTYAVTGFVVGRWAPAVERSSRWLAVGIAALAAVGANLAYVVLARLVDQRDLLGPELWPVLAVAAVGAAVLVLPLLRVGRWVWDVQADVAIRLR